MVHTVHIEEIERIIGKIPSLEKIIEKVWDRRDLFPWGNPLLVVDGRFVVHDMKYLDHENFQIAVTNETTPRENRFDERERDQRLGIYLGRKQDGKLFKLSTPVIPYIRIGRVGMADYYGSPHESDSCFVNLTNCEQIEVGYCDQHGRKEKEVLEDSGNGLVNPLIGQQRRYTIELWKLMQDIRRKE